MIRVVTGATLLTIFSYCVEKADRISLDTGAGIDQETDRLIKIQTLEQLNAIRYDLNGDGIADDPDNQTLYMASGLMGEQGCLPEGCLGYQLTVDLDFNSDGSQASSENRAAASAGDLYWNNGLGWKPIGDCGESNSCDIATDNRPFTAIFSGNGHTIRNLYIDREGENILGLFGYISGSQAAIDNLNLTDVDLAGLNAIGALVALNLEGNISNCYTSGEIRVENALAGNIVSASSGVITNCHASGTVNGIENIGQLGGINSGTIENCYASGTTYGNKNIGSLIGNNMGEIKNSYANGMAEGSENIGGLVGLNDENGSIENSYASGMVEGSENIGGLVGLNDENGSIKNSYASGMVEGLEDIGGLVGEDQSSSISIEGSYWDNTTSGQTVGIGRGNIRQEVRGIGSDSMGALNASVTGWDDSLWEFGNNRQYPALKNMPNGLEAQPRDLP